MTNTKNNVRVIMDEQMKVKYLIVRNSGKFKC